MLNLNHLYLLLVGIFCLLLFVRSYFRFNQQQCRLKNQSYYSEYPCFFGLAKRVFWRPGGTVLFFRNQAIYCPDPHGQGGSRTVSHLMNETVCTWLPLTFQSSIFEYPTLATRENSSLGLKLQVLWKINNVAQFSKLFDSFVQNHNQADCSNLTAYCEQILRYIAKNILQKIMYQTTMSQLLFFCPQNLPRYADNYPQSAVDLAGRADFFAQLGQQVQTRLSQQSTNFGVQILEISIQEIHFPDAIQARLDGYLAGLIDERIVACQARQRLAQLQVEIQSYGEKAASLRYVLSVFRNCQFFGANSFNMNSLLRMIEEFLAHIKDQPPEHPNSQTPHWKIAN